jgi:hypothetical protein
MGRVGQEWTQGSQAKEPALAPIFHTQPVVSMFPFLLCVFLFFSVVEKHHTEEVAPC